jgi:hypothetical protein
LSRKSILEDRPHAAPLRPAVAPRAIRLRAWGLWAPATASSGAGLCQRVCIVKKKATFKTSLAYTIIMSMSEHLKKPKGTFMDDAHTLLHPIRFDLINPSQKTAVHQ